MTESNPDYGDIISTEVLIIPQHESLKESVPEKGNLTQLAEDMSEKFIDGIDTVADKIHDLILGPEHDLKQDLPLIVEPGVEELDIKKKGFQKNLEKLPTQEPQLQHEIKFDKAQQTLKDFHLSNRFTYLRNLNPEQATMEQTEFNKPDYSHGVKRQVRSKEEKYLERAFFPMTFDFSHSTIQDTSYQNREMRVRPMNYKTIRERRLWNRIMPERWRRPERKHASTHLDKILDKDEIRIENERLYNKAMQHQIKQVAPEIQTVFTRDDVAFSARVKSGTHFDDIHMPPSVKVGDVSNIIGKNTAGYRNLGYLGIQPRIYQLKLRHQNLLPSIRKTPHHSHLHDVEIGRYEIKSLREPKLPYLGSLKRQNQYRFKKVDPSHIPDISFSLRQGLEIDKLKYKRQTMFREQIQKEKINESKPAAPVKPSGFVGMYQ